MSRRINRNQPTVSLSVGNVVSAGLRIYRDNFKLYYTQALLSYLWLIVPIYGWAKFATIQGLISRLAFSEIIERPETLEEARQEVKPKLWTFFTAGLLVGLILFGALFFPAIIIGIMAGISATLIQQNSPLSIILILLIIVAFVTLIFGYIWLYSRLSIVELPIAIESQVSASASIGRSWKLTKGFVGKLQLIFLVAFLITLPLSLAVNLVSLVIPPDSPIYTPINLVLSIGIGALLIPFWQSIKAVLYYDLRSRKEGLGLEIRDASPEDREYPL